MTKKSQKDGITTKFIAPYIGILLLLSALVLGLETPASNASISNIQINIPILPVTAVTAILLLFCVTIQNLLPSNLREVIVFWRFDDRLPGFRAFSKIAQADARINTKRISALGGSPNLSPKQQNELWYQWYMQFPNEPSVWNVGRLYLAYRDLASVIVITSPIAILVWLMSTINIGVIMALIGFILISYLATIIVARNKANELVSNVLALKSGASNSEPRILRP
jgi:hypothetical protein